MQAVHAGAGVAWQDLSDYTWFLWGTPLHPSNQSQHANSQPHPPNPRPPQTDKQQKQRKDKQRKDTQRKDTQRRQSRPEL